MLVYFNKELGFDERWSKEELPEYEEKVKNGICDKIILNLDDEYNVEKYRYKIVLDENGNYKIRIKDKETQEVVYDDLIEKFNNKG